MQVCIVSLLLANMDKITCWISNPQALANKQAPLPSTYPYFAPLSRQLMIIPCYCQLPVLPSARGWIKAAQNKALTRNCRATWISGFFSSCHYSLLNVHFYEEKTIRITRTKPSQHTTQAPVLCVLRLALHATHSIQAVWKQQSKSQNSQGCSCKLPAPLSTGLTWVFEVSVERLEGNYAALSKLRTQLHWSYTTKNSEMPPYSFSSNVLSALVTQ